MAMGAIQRDDAEVDAMVADLQRDGRIEVKNDERTFWILHKSWRGVLDYYAPSWDGKSPAEPFRLMPDHKLWNWLARLERA
jgi:hypothetical protein